MRKKVGLVQILFSKVVNKIFWTYKKYRSLLSNKPKKKLLFSSSMGYLWIENIKKGFSYTKHQVDFKEFTFDNITGYDCIIPIVVSEIIFVKENELALIKDNPIPIPSKESIKLCDDKIQFNSTLTENGFEKYIPKMGGTNKFPFILKKKIDAGGENCHIISNKKQLYKYSELINNSEYFTQEIIVGPTEYVTHILFKNKKIANSVNIKYVFETDLPIKGQDKAAYIRVCNCPYLNLFTSILNSINFEGICNVGYKVRNNHPMIIEINPRCGHSLSPYLFPFIEPSL